MQNRVLVDAASPRTSAENKREQRSVDHYTNRQIHKVEENDRPLWAAMRAGFFSRCPACGNGNLFLSGLKTEDHCRSCNEALHHHRADDLPAYLNIFLVGHVVVGLMLLALKMELFGIFTLGALSVGFALLLSILLMRPLKGAVVGAQWALKMHGFGGHDG